MDRIHETRTAPIPKAEYTPEHLNPKLAKYVIITDEAMISNEFDLISSLVPVAIEDIVLVSKWLIITSSLNHGHFRDFGRII